MRTLRANRLLISLLCTVSLAVLPAAAKTVTLNLGSNGETIDPPGQANAGDAIVVNASGATVKYFTYTTIPTISDTTNSCAATGNKDGSTSKSNAALVYLVCGANGMLRTGIVILGPQRKVFYLRYSWRDGSPGTPLHLEPVGDLPALTTDDEPILVIVNKKNTDLPQNLDLDVTTKAGSYVDVAPVRPQTTQPAASAKMNAVPAAKPAAGTYVDYVLRFPRAKYPGEQIVDYSISGYFEAETSKEKTITEDAPPPKDGAALQTETVTKTDSASHQIYSGELPQIHSLYHFNITTGIMASFLRDPSYSRVITKLKVDDNNPAQYATVQEPGSDRAIPVLMFSAYLKPMDAQVPWRRSDLIPAPTLGFSMSSPADDFFFGLSHEIRRHVQLVYGYNLGNVTTSPRSQGVDDPTSSAAPTTVKRFKGNFFVGVTFNVSFISSLFK